MSFSFPSLRPASPRFPAYEMPTQPTLPMPDFFDSELDGTDADADMDVDDEDSADDTDESQDDTPTA